MKKLLLSLVTVFLVSGMYAQLDDYDLLIHLEFEDETDLALNDQDVTADGVEYTAEASTDAAIGAGAASFDGSQYIIFDKNELITCTMSYTWAMWAKTSAANGSIIAWAPYSGTPAGPIGEFDENDPHQPQVHALFFGFSTGAPTFDVGWVGLIEGATVINDDAWHHIAVTVDVEGLLQVLYIDGVAQEETGDWDVNDPGEPPEIELTEFVLKVGYSSSEWPSDEEETIQLPWFTGILDDVRMYDGALTADDIAELFAYTSVYQTLDNFDFGIYPNPAVDYIRVKSDRLVDISIYNAVGQEMLRKLDVQNEDMIDISDLRSGIYFVKSGQFTQKLMVR